MNEFHITREELTFPGGRSAYCRKKEPLRISPKQWKNKPQTLAEKKRRASKSYGIAEIFKNVGNVIKNTPFRTCRKRGRKKRALTAAGEPMGNVEIPWKNEGSPRFTLIAQPQALRAILEILGHRRIL